MAIKIEVGKFYVTRDGLKVGPMVFNTLGSWGHPGLFVSEGRELNPICENGEILDKPQAWEADGSVYFAVRHEAGHAIVSEFVEKAAHELEDGREYTLKNGDKVTMTFRDDNGGYFVGGQWHYHKSGVACLWGRIGSEPRPYVDVDWAASTAKSRAPLQIVAGRYYITDERKVEGPMVFCGGWFSSDVKNTKQIDSGAFKDAPQYWLKDGSVALPQAGEESHVLVREVAAPGFRIEEGKHYVLASGEVVGPVELNAGMAWVDGFKSKGKPAVNQVWNEDGTVFGEVQGEEDQYIVREADPIPVDKDAVIVTLDVDTSGVTALIEEVRAEIEAAAAACLVQVEEKDREIAELKREAAGRQQDIRGFIFRIETYDALVVAKNRQIGAQNEIIAQLDAELAALKESFNILHKESQVSKDFADRMIDRLERKNGERVKVNLRLRKAREDIKRLKNANKGLCGIIERDKVEIRDLRTKQKEPSTSDMIVGFLSLMAIYGMGYFSHTLAAWAGLTLPF